MQNSSIVSCTEEFVRGLQKDFPATVPTIFRTGDKLVAMNVEAGKEHDPSGDSNRSENLCALCALHLDTEKGEASALHATVVSEKYSNKRYQEILQQKAIKVKHDAANQECGKVRSDEETYPDSGGGICGCARAGGGCSKTDMNVDRNWEAAKTLEQYLCYGCRITLRDLVSKTLHNEAFHIMLVTSLKLFHYQNINIRGSLFHVVIFLNSTTKLLL